MSDDLYYQLEQDEILETGERFVLDGKLVQIINIEAVQESEGHTYAYLKIKEVLE